MAEPRSRGEDMAWKNGGAVRAADLPVWVRAAAIVGIPGVIAFFLVWVGASDLPRISRAAEANTLELVYQRKLIEEHGRQQAAQNDRMIKVLQQMCVHQARKDGLDVRSCFD